MSTAAPSPFGGEETILIIEDEPTERMLAKVHLERAGYCVLEANDGPHGLDLAREHRPDLVIVNINLPSGSGFDVCRAIRAHKPLVQVPILISTAYEDTDSIDEGFVAGATDFLTKPTTWSLLAYRVKFLLRSSKVERELAAANERARVNEIALRESERHFRELFEHAPVMMHRTDKAFRLQDVNKAWLATMGYERDDVINRDLIEFMDTETREILCSTLRPNFIESGTLVDSPCRLLRKDGQPIDTLVTSKGEYDNDGEFLWANTVLLDVTERRRAERKMREAQEAAEAASRAKSVFLATMSHEIRTPLNGVIGMIDLIEQTELDANQASMIGTIRDSAYALLNIIGDILDFSKIEAGELTIEQIDYSVTSVIEGVVETLLPLAIEKNIELNVFTEPKVPELVSGDPVRIRQILFNLIGNAIKFSENKDGRPAEVNVRSDLCQPEDAGAPIIRFSVADTGMGISPEHRTRLFTPFFQAEDSTVRRFGGTGLGLSICKNLVDLMGGTIHVESRFGEGSTFVVELPLTIPQSTARNLARRLDGKRILFASPDPTLRSNVETYLSHDGAQIVLVDSFRQVREKLRAAGEADRPFDAVIFAHSQPRTIDAENKIISKISAGLDASKTGVVVLSADRRNRTKPVLPDAVLVSKQPLSRSQLLRAVMSACGTVVEDSNQPGGTGPRHRGPATGGDIVKGMILVAEDNTINQLVIQRQLGQFGYEADMASDGAEALDAYRKGDYGLLLTDCHMPEMDGFELTQAIRELEKGDGTRIPIIAITANALQGEAGRCIAAGMDDFLTKPVELDKLGMTLEKWLDRPEIRASSDLPHAETEPNHAASEGAEPDSGGDYKPSARDDETDLSQPENEPIDMAMLARLLGTDDDTYLLEMISVYWDTMCDTPDELAALVSTRDASGLRDAAHAAKGASASVGAVSAASLLKELQFAAAEANWDRVDILMPKIGEAFLALENYVENVRAA